MTRETSRKVSAGLLFAGLSVIVFTFRDYGASWDEPTAANYGELVLAYFQSGFADLRANSLTYYKNYGPAFELLSAAVYQFIPEWKYDIRHLLAALAALGGIAGLMRFGGLFRDPWVPVFAGLALALLPRYYGHAFINGKDIPFACFFAWGMFTACRLFVTENPRWRDYVYCGIAIGLALAVRIGGFLAFAFIAAGIVLSLIPHGGKAFARLRGALTPALFARGALLLGTAWLIMIAFWPWAHENPVLRPLETFLYMNSFPVSYPVLFGGATIPSDQLPDRYLVQYLGMTTPPGVLFLMLVGLVASFRAQWTDFRSREAFLSSMAQLWLFFPIAFVWVTRPNVYDGLRHFLFILPALCLFTGLGATRLLTMAGKDNTRRALAAGLLTGLLLVPIKDLVALHPYQMTYFNGFAGGVAHASTRYEADYWATSYREAALWLNAKRISSGRDHLDVLFAANPVLQDCFTFYLDPEIRRTRVWSHFPASPLPDDVDYYVGISRYGYADDFAQAPVVHQVGREGARFAVIRGRPD